MRWITFLLVSIVVVSCGARVPFTSQMIEDYNLYSEKQLAKVQFYTSQTITLNRVKKVASGNHASNGVLVENSSNHQDRITIQAQTPGIVEKSGEDGQIYIRFEQGKGKFLSFKVRPNAQNGRFYLDAQFTMNNGGELTYGEDRYSVSSAAGQTYLMVVVKKIQNSTSRDRVVRGMKI
jgi:hypothetical protein